MKSRDNRMLLAVLIGCGQWSGSRCGLYVTSKGFETSSGSPPTLMAPWAVLITTGQATDTVAEITSLVSHRAILNPWRTASVSAVMAT